MLPSFFGLNTVTRALLAQQEAVDVVNQNIANASTPGYSRQEAILTATDPYTVPAFDRPGLSGQLGTGVTVSRINRYQDELLNAQIRSGSQSIGQLTTMDDSFTQIQAIYNDPSSVAINSAATSFFTSIHDLSNNPESTAAREAMQQQGLNLASAVTSRYQQLTALQGDLNVKVQGIVADINSTIKQIASFNTQIAEVRATGDNPNDLMDQRDQLVDHLSQLVDTRDVKNIDGTDTIQMNGRFLVNKDQAYTLTTLTDANSPALVKPVKVFWTEDVTKFQNVHPGFDPVSGKNLTTGALLTSTDTPPLSVPPALITTGSLAGAMQIRDQVIQGTLLPQLNELADSLTNTQVLSNVTGLTAKQQLSGAQNFTVTVLPNAPLGNVKSGQPVSFVVKMAAGRSVQDVIDAINGGTVNINGAAVNISSFVHASLNAAGQLQIDTINPGTLVKVDQASPAASKDFGFSASVADGFNMVHAEGYGLNTPPQITGGVSGLTLATQVNVGDGFTIVAPDGASVNVVVPSPIAPATQRTVADVIAAVNAAGLSHGVQAALDAGGHLIIYSSPSVFGPGGQLIGTAAQVVGSSTTGLTSTATFTGGASAGTITISGPTGTAAFTTAAGETLGQLLQAINSSNLGVTASLNSEGQFQLATLGTGSLQSLKVTVAGGSDVTGAAPAGQIGLALATTTVNGLDRGFLPSASITVNSPLNATTGTDFLGSVVGAGPPPPVVTALNSNQFFFQGAQQSLQNQMMSALAATSSLSTGAPTTFTAAANAFTQPSFPAPITLTLVGSNAGPTNVFTVSGTDVTGAAITDTLSFTADGTATTSKIFQSVTSISSGGGIATAAGFANARLAVAAATPATQYDTAASLGLDARIANDVTLIAASSVPAAPGNAINALALLNVQQQATIGTGQTASTIGDFYSSATANLGATASETHTSALTQQQLVQHIQNQKQSLVGVSLDEEASHLVALQHAYEAAARAITTQDSMLNTIINGMGLVGLAGGGG